MESHEAVCILNVGDEDAEIQITVFYEERDPVGPYCFTVAARRTRHLRFNDFSDPQPIPRGTAFASVIESSVPVVVAAHAPGFTAKGERLAEHHGLPRELKSEPTRKPTWQKQQPTCSSKH